LLSGADSFLTHDVSARAARCLQSWTALSCASWWTR
jgi:hypothetical protein